MASFRSSPARLLLIVALTAGAGLALLGWSYVRVERSLAARTHRGGVARQAGAEAASTRDAQVAKARGLLEAGDNAGAVAALDRALSVVPGDAEALALQVRAFRAQRHYAAARSTARRILDSFPQSPLAHVLLGSIALQDGDAVTARRDLARAVDLDTSSALALAQLAALDLMEGRVADARSRASRALALDPANPTALRVLVRVSRSVPDLISLFRRLAEANPEDRLTRSWLEVLRASAVPEVNYVPPVVTEVAVPCEVDADGRLYVRARVGPFAHLRLLLDTGASGLTLSERLARRMGMRLKEFSESAGVGGLTRHSHPILVDRIDLGGVRARALMATASNLPQQLDGIINPILFAPPGGGAAMELRPARRTLIYSPAPGGRWPSRSPAERWATVPYLADGNHIIFSIVLAGRPARALLDTGASVDLVDRSVLERLPGTFVRPSRGMGDSLIGFGGTIEDAQTVEQVTLRIAGRDFITNRFYVLDLNDEAFRFQVDIDAIVGMTRLAAFDMRVNPGGGSLSFRPAD